MAAWKDLERKTAKQLGGQRVHRGDDFGESKGDVDHPLLSIECKYRKKLSAFLKDGIRQAKSYDTTGEKVPLLVLRARYQRPLVVLELSDFEDLFGSLQPQEVTDG